MRVRVSSTSTARSTAKRCGSAGNSAKRPSVTITTWTRASPAGGPSKQRCAIGISTSGPSRKSQSKPCVKEPRSYGRVTFKLMDLEAAAGAIDTFLRALGRDSERDPSLAGTGARVATMFAEELLAGYAVDVDALLSQSV